MRTGRFGVIAAALAGTSALLIGGGLATPGDRVPPVKAQATGTTTQTVTTTTTTTATATSTATTTATPTGSPSATATTATASPTATATRTNTPVPTATTVPPTTAPTQPATAPINLTLSGANEVPPVTSSGTGTFRATPGTNSLAYTLTASGTATGITMAHIHSGAPGVNGPIVADLIVPNTAGTASINRSGTITQADLKGPMAGDMAGFMAALRAGTLYVNVHTIANPAGELRANFPAPPAPPATGTSAATDDSSRNLLYLAGALSGLSALVFGAGAVARRRV